MDEFMQAAIAQAKQGLKEGGIPIGSVLVKDNQIIACQIVRKYVKVK